MQLAVDEESPTAGPITSPVIGVVGGRGGVGASLFTAVLSAVGARLGHSGRSVLVDLEAVAGGIDVLLGVEGVPGPRWSGLRLAGGYLQPSLLGGGLPRWGAVSVLAADLMPSAADVAQLLPAAAEIGPVAVELGRWPSPTRDAALDQCDVVCLVTRCDVASVTAARTVALALAADGRTVPLGIVTRRMRSAPDAHHVADLIGAPLIGSLPPVDVGDTSLPIDANRLPRSMDRVAAGVWEGLLAAGGAASGSFVPAVMR
ncbi:hypothetical protein SAMN05444157_3758 [Frankineae bacterium MT45]|nr:hypothetical protein SAMN05444157_3758 [Frankineae bacterium MT45]